MVGFALFTVAFPTLPTEAVSAEADASFTSGGSINQVYTYGHEQGAALELLNSTNEVVAQGVADAQGAKLFKDVATGSGYRVRSGASLSDDLTVTDPADHPDQSFYDNITLNEGFGYLPTRDGTLLSVNITFPFDGSPQPWPVVIDYSGYDPSEPGLPPREALFYPFRGYVVVGVNMRGTTCSGGAFDFFEQPQRTDGYDAVEALAAQPWSNGDVGLVGISYSGYSQLYVAATQPPHLRAITPLSPYADTYRSILYPGGILNNGFALNWAADRQEAARPAAHGWVKSRISNGDEVCAGNQVMRLQSRDLLAEITPGRFDERPLGDYLDTTTFADQISVPSYLATQFQDEQTGGHAAELAPILGTDPRSKAVFTNGTHVEPLGPTELPRVLEFIDFYVGKKIPSLGDTLRIGVPAALRSLFGDPILDPPPDRFANYSDYPTALAAYEAEPPVRIRWQNGGKQGLEGAPYSVHDTSYPAWPIPSVVPHRWFLAADGQLLDTAPTIADAEARGASSYTYDPSSKRRQTFDRGTEDMWRAHPDVHWNPLAEGKSLSFTTAVYVERTAYAGTGSVDLWIRSSAADTDMEVTLTEVRPDGNEQAIQSGWLRASHRALAPSKSTVLRPYQTHQESDAAPLPTGEFVPVRIELFPFAHIVAPGSKLRLNIEAPGGNQPFWAYDALPGVSTNELAHSVGRPSSVVLPRLPTNLELNLATADGTPNPCVVPGVVTQSVSYRNQPCRPYRPARTPTSVAAAVSGAALLVSWSPPPLWADGSSGTLTGYKVTASPGGQQFEVPANETSLLFQIGQSGTRYSFIVSALFGGYEAPSSDASLASTYPGTSTTTTTTPTTTTIPPTSGPTTLPSGTIPSPPGKPDNSAPAGPSAAERGDRYVPAAYLTLLDRTVDSSGLRFWNARLAQGASRTSVALHLVNTDESRRKLVNSAYQKLLGRRPSSSELRGASRLLQAGLTVDDLRVGLLGSVEFWRTAGATPSGFVDAVHRTALDRPAEPSVESVMLAALGDGRSTGDLAAWLVRTQEFDQRIVVGWYSSILSRTPSTSEAEFWTQRLRSGRSESSITAELVGSSEFLRNVGG